MRRLILGLSCAFLGQPAWAATHHATPETFWNVVAKVAKPGDEVDLAPGSYGGVNFVQTRFKAPGVIIKGSSGVIFDWITLDSTAGFDIRDIEITGKGRNDWSISVKGSDSTRLAGIHSHSADGFGSGLLFIESTNSVAENNIIDHRSIGIGVIDSSGAKLVGNTVAVMAVDGVDIFGSSNVVIEGTTGSDFAMAKNAHPDFIQFAGTPKNPGPVGLQVRNNNYQRGKGSYAQGVFGKDYTDVVIEGNSLLGTMGNGISVSKSSHVTVNDNFVQGWPDTGSRIVIREGSKDVTVTNNWTNQVNDVTDAATGPNERLTISGTHKISEAKPGDLSTLNKWNARRDPAASKEAK